MKSRLTDVFSDEVLNIVFDELQIGLTVVDNKGQVIYYNRFAQNLLGWTDSSSENSVLKCHSPDSVGLVLKKINGNTKKEWHRIIQQKDKFIENIYLPLILKDKGRGIIIITRDVTGREQMKNKLQKAAITDSQTGLYNRRYFDILHSEILEKKESFSAIMIDVNGLKFINDNFGHETGNSIIVEAARIISKSVRESDYIFRYGGDEFVVLLLTDDVGVCKSIVERIKANNSKPSHQEPVVLNLSAGYCSSSEQILENVISCADTRMYKDKQDFYNNEGKFIKEYKKL